jgi:N-acetylglucosamine-6-sulfatase
MAGVQQLRKWLSLATVIVAALLLAGCAAQGQEVLRKPNILFILTDDQEPASVAYMPAVERKLVAGGTTFENAFGTTPQCCPSRASILRGQYAHNHNVLHNKPPGGGFEKFRNSGRERSTFATWLSAGGYRTAFLGKYLNGYEAEDKPPPGWDKWWGWDPGRGDTYEVNANGHVETHDSSRKAETDYFADQAVSFVRDREGDLQPWLLWVSVNPPKGGRYVAPRHRSMFSDAELPRPPSFNEADVSDKPRAVRSRPMLGRKGIKKLEKLYRDRLRSLQSVDEMVARLFATLEGTGQLEHTYIIFASDNGYSLYEHRALAKGWPYENPQRIPLIVRGPDVPAGASRGQLVGNTDLAPTFAELAGVEPPTFVDGRSFHPLMRGETPPWREQLLFEHWGWRRYDAMRTAGGEVYIEWMNGDREYYDLSVDPYQLQNTYKGTKETDPALIADLETRLDALRSCSEEEACRIAENDPGP